MYFSINKVGQSPYILRGVLYEGLLEYHKAGDEIEGTQRVANLQELVNSAVPYDFSMEGLLAFLDSINLDRSLELQSDKKNEDAVTLITLHNTKGLEYNREGPGEGARLKILKIS